MSRRFTQTLHERAVGLVRLAKSEADAGRIESAIALWCEARGYCTESGAPGAKRLGHIVDSCLAFYNKRAS